ncbi:glycosyl hydrolase family 95 catalytic domain-containing protein [Silvibacterium acidisoli]|uniref:glycosyl hydrolase family 95 catalytic domain-containing protein n=1 Tax=Acidobacteriaceae bacterium ZG23-2 TaxID=2883246 RepID=UPI00406D3A9B
MPTIFSLRCFSRLALVGLAVLPSSFLYAQNSGATSAWKNGHFEVDVPGVVRRSNIVLARPNLLPSEAMPLGNGRLGLGVWSADGLTLQLNREDTWPFRVSPGHVVVPGLRRMTEASDYKAQLDLYNGELVESGGGITATTYVDDSCDTAVIEVSGVSPGEAQTAELKLWPGREPHVLVSATAGALAETWRDTNEMGASGLTFGSLSAITADARDLKVASDALSVKLSFHAKTDGSYRVMIASPEWRGGDALGAAAELFRQASGLTAGEHRTWWHDFWKSASLIRLSSQNGEAEYFENLRTIDLFTMAAESRDRFPGSQAGAADLFNPFGDNHHWGPSAYWHWNLRMQVSANFGAGLASFNEPYFNLYNDNMDAVAKWTREHMGGRRGLCVPETMRFNGPGYENETWLKAAGINCTEDGQPYYNARTISTGAEVALWVWQQYLYTDDLSFLESHYPLMRESARFLLAYARRNPDGTLYTYPSNAHESNWDVKSPTTDVSAMHALFPVLLEAAKALGVEDDVTKQARAAISALPEIPEQLPGTKVLLHGAERSNPKAIVANSYTPGAIVHNSENLGLEPVWPYGLIGDAGPMHALGVETFMQRPNKSEADWSADPVQAARLGLADQMKLTLEQITERYQYYPSGFAQLTEFPEFYAEQIGVVADALQSGLVQDYDGLIRVLPAWPKDWAADGTVTVRHGNRVHVQVRDGRLVTLGLDAVHTSDVKVRNPWPGQVVTVTDAASGQVVKKGSEAVITIGVKEGSSYLLRAGAESGPPAFAEVTGTPATSAKKLGTRTIGLFH